MTSDLRETTKSLVFASEKTIDVCVHFSTVFVSGGGADAIFYVHGTWRPTTQVALIRIGIAVEKCIVVVEEG